MPSYASLQDMLRDLEYVERYCRAVGGRLSIRFEKTVNRGNIYTQETIDNVRSVRDVENILKNIRDLVYIGTIFLTCTSDREVEIPVLDLKRHGVHIENSGRIVMYINGARFDRGKIRLRCIANHARDVDQESNNMMCTLSID